MKDLGYRMDTGVLPVGRLPKGCVRAYLKTAYRGTGSTTGSVAQISTDCKKRAGHIAQQCGDMPRPVFTGMSADLTGQRMSYTDLMVRFCSSSSTLREVCTVTR